MWFAANHRPWRGTWWSPRMRSLMKSRRTGLAGRECGGIRIAKFDLVRRPDAASGDDGRPSLLSASLHAPSVHAVSTFTAAGQRWP
ncbi:MAG: hypothetical protein CM15mP128_4070 [Methanobacteriota archaeon]|nr:MAG: hypothetical protein CM15mP128_4070 [Euryarchaeota archaeon]